MTPLDYITAARVPADRYPPQTFGPWRLMRQFITPGVHDLDRIRVGLNSERRLA